MTRAIWRGSISFGLVTIPVRLYTAVRRQDVRFRELDRRTGQRVRHQRVRAIAEAAPQQWPAEATAAERVTREDLARGYEVAPGRYVEVTDEDIAEVAPERTRAIDVEQFVSRAELDPIYFDTSYYVVPDLDRVRPFAVLLRALQETNRAAVCWLVLRSRRRLAAIHPRDQLMLLTTLHFADEIVAPAGLARPLPGDLSDREIDMAELLVKTLAGPFEPERYPDEYRDRVLALIEGRAGRAEMIEAEAPPAAAPAGVEELMAALAASVEEARARRARDAEQESRRREAGGR